MRVGRAPGDGGHLGPSDGVRLSFSAAVARWCGFSSGHHLKHREQYFILKTFSLIPLR